MRFVGIERKVGERVFSGPEFRFVVFAWPFFFVAGGFEAKVLKQVNGLEVEGGGVEVFGGEGVAG